MNQVNFALLKLARKLRGYTQNQVAELAGISQSVYSKIENGLLAVSEENLNKLAAAFRFPPQFFFSMC